MSSGTARLEIVSNSPEKTLEIGREIGAALAAGSLAALCGPLGAGKTQLVKGIALGLGIAESVPIVSPTFVLIREYAGRRPLVHVDVYRLTSGEELAALGLDERLDAGDVVVVEWADRFRAAWPAGTLWIEMSHAGPQARGITVCGPLPIVSALKLKK